MKLDFSKVGTDQPDRTVTVSGSSKFEQPTQYNVMDIEAAKKSFAVYKTRLDEAVKRVKAFVVDSDRKEKELSETLLKCASLFKTVEKFRKEKIYDADKFVRGFNSFVKSFRDPLEIGIKEGKKKIGAYQYKKLLRDRETEAKAQKEVARLQTEMDARAKKAGVPPVTMPAMVQSSKSGPVRTESGSASTRMEWTWELENLSQVQREYLGLDKNLVDAAVKAGIRKIEGIRIFEQPKVSLRTG
jgi:hypothetical protein